MIIHCSPDFSSSISNTELDFSSSISRTQLNFSCELTNLFIVTLTLIWHLKRFNNSVSYLWHTSSANESTVKHIFVVFQHVLGKWSPTVFAIALLASGQSTSISGTYAGQYIMQVNYNIINYMFCSFFVGLRLLCHVRNIKQGQGIDYYAI